MQQESKRYKSEKHPQTFAREAFKSLKRHARTSAKHVEGNMTGTLNLEMKQAGRLEK